MIDTVTLRPGDYVCLRGLHDTTVRRLADAFINAGARKSSVYPYSDPIWDYLGWSVSSGMCNPWQAADRADGRRKLTPFQVLDATNARNPHHHDIHPDWSQAPDDAKASAAVKTLEHLDYRWLGGKVWRPPTGCAPDSALVTEGQRKRIEDLIQQNVGLRAEVADLEAKAEKERKRAEGLAEELSEARENAKRISRARTHYVDGPQARLEAMRANGLIDSLREKIADLEGKAKRERERATAFSEELREARENNRRLSRNRTVAPYKEVSDKLETARAQITNQCQTIRHYRAKMDRIQAVLDDNGADLE